MGSLNFSSAEYSMLFLLNFITLIHSSLHFAIALGFKCYNKFDFDILFFPFVLHIFFTIIAFKFVMFFFTFTYCESHSSFWSNCTACFPRLGVFLLNVTVKNVVV